MRHALPFFLFFCALMGSWEQATLAEIYGTPETGLLSLKRKHPYMLFVPKEYSTEKSWPLAIVFLSGIDKDKHAADIQPWVEWAEQHQLLALFPTVLPKPGSVSNTEVDRWVLRLKKDVLERYRISSSEILLVGAELGAHYAAYLGLNYPEEFSAAGLLRQAWVGPFEKLMRTTTNRRKQTDFYVAVDPKDALFGAVERKALELEKKGYQIRVEPLAAEEDLLSARDRMIQWFRENSEYRALRKKSKSRSNFRAKLLEMRKNMFGV